MDEANLAEIEARAEAATPGPWTARTDAYDPVVLTAADERYIAQTSYDNLSGTIDHNVREDAVFIAHAREDVPDLIAEMRRLRWALRQVHLLADAEEPSSVRAGAIAQEALGETRR